MRWILFGPMLAVQLVRAVGAAEPDPERLDFIDNGQVRIGVDLDHGGAIGYLADAKRRENVINVHDGGRYVSQSYYGGPQPFGAAHPAWKNWPWNPVSAGDAFGHPARVLDHRNDGRTLFVKSQPQQWALNNVPGDCTFETWITLDERTANVRCRLTNLRADHAQYQAFDQELPAVYTIGSLHRLFAYVGDRPFAGGPLSEIRQPPSQQGAPHWAKFQATEHWAALVDDHDWGLGVYHSGVVEFLGGFYGQPGNSGPHGEPTGYIAPVRKEILDHDIVYEYQFNLILDTLENIRRYAVAHRPANHLPDYRFERDRQHWWYVNAADTGQPIHGRLHVLLEHGDPQLIGPEALWNAREAPKLYIRAAFHTEQKFAQLFWQTRDEPQFAAERSVRVPISPDGQPHTYEVDLSSAPRYRGMITRLRFDPVDNGGPGQWMELIRISSRAD